MVRKIATVSIGLGLALLWGSPTYGQAQGSNTSQSASAGQDQTGAGAQGAGSTTSATLDLTSQVFTGGDATALQRSATTGFVGGNAQGVGNLRGQMGAATGVAGQMNTLGMMGGMNPLTSLYTANMLNNLSRQRRPLRMPITLGSEFTSGLVPAATPVKVGGRVQSQLARIPQVRGSGAVKVEMDGRIAVLRGEVKSQHDRDLIGRMLLLEPGVSDVRNELVVAPPEAKSTAP